MTTPLMAPLGGTGSRPESASKTARHFRFLTMKPLHPSSPPRASCSASPSSCSSSPCGRRPPSAAWCQDLPGRPADHGRQRLDAADRAGLREGHRHDGVARARRLPDRRRAGAAAGRGDGRLQAGRGLLRALRLLRALPAGQCVHPAADPVGRHRRGAEAGGDLHRQLLPAGADDRGDAWATRGATWSRRPTRWAQRPRPGPPRADARRARPRSPRPCAWCWAGPGPT